jgi:hypothetical protein
MPRRASTYRPSSPGWEFTNPEMTYADPRTTAARTSDAPLRAASGTTRSLTHYLLVDDGDGRTVAELASSDQARSAPRCPSQRGAA